MCNRQTAGLALWKKTGQTGTKLTGRGEHAANGLVVVALDGIERLYAWHQLSPFVDLMHDHRQVHHVKCVLVISRHVTHELVDAELLLHSVNM